MELPLQLADRGIEVTSENGFNPCFNGTTSATRSRIGQKIHITTVSILVLMELPLQLFQLILFILCNLVSILVLMELPLQPLSKNFSLGFFVCFNPCFNGTTSATKNATVLIIDDLLFQSLF